MQEFRNMPKSRWLILGALSVFGAVRASAQEIRVVELTVEPPQIALHHADDRQRLLVTGKLADGGVRDLTRLVQFKSQSPAVATISPHGVAAPKAPGEAVIRVSGFGIDKDVPV